MSQSFTEHDHLFAHYLDGRSSLKGTFPLEGRAARRRMEEFHADFHQLESASIVSAGIMCCEIDFKATERVSVDDDFAITEPWMEGGPR